ncbi:MAG: cytochrome c oxidase subunit II [Gemmatimonadales bacterium]
MLLLQQALQFPGRISVLRPVGPDAVLVRDALWRPMYTTALVTYVLVVGALLWAAFRRRSAGAEETQRERGMGIVVGIATGITTVVLFAFLVATVHVSRANNGWPGPDPIRIRVIGHQWWWEVQYRNGGQDQWFTTANELHLPVGRPAELELVSPDVIHSFWSPNLRGKIDLIPGHENLMRLEADSAGVFRGQCAEFCGFQHAKMAFLVIAQPADSFAAWLARQRTPAPEPTDSLGRRGRDVFLGGSCPLCHTVQGTSAGGHLGPDLTHLGGRRTIAAGTLPNTRGALAGWIVNPQDVKPGAKMPPNPLSPDDLQAILAYLESLK